MDLPSPPLEPALHDRLRRESRLVHLPAGARAFTAGQKAPFFLLVERGTVRVVRTSAEGREVVLYRVHAGESCILTAAAVLGDASWSGLPCRRKPVHPATSKSRENEHGHGIGRPLRRHGPVYRRPMAGGRRRRPAYGD